MIDLIEKNAVEIIIAVFSIGGAWFVTSYRLDQAEVHRKEDREQRDNEHSDLWREIGKTREWQTKHQEDGLNHRLESQQKMTVLEIAQSKNEERLVALASKSEERFLAMMNIMEEIRKDIRQNRGHS